MFMYSENALQSPWTEKEVDYASGQGMTILPVLISGVMPTTGWFSFDYGNIDCVDITNPVQKEKLISNLKVTYKDRIDEFKKQQEAERIKQEEKERIEAEKKKLWEEELKSKAKSEFEKEKKTAEEDDKKNIPVSTPVEEPSPEWQRMVKKYFGKGYLCLSMVVFVLSMLFKSNVIAMVAVMMGVASIVLLIVALCLKRSFGMENNKQVFVFIGIPIFLYFMSAAFAMPYDDAAF